MSDATFFDRLDAVALAIATERFGFAFAAASARVGPSVAVDHRISPTVMVAGICRAHAAGIASAIASCGHAVDGPMQRALLEEQLVTACTAFIREQLRGEPAAETTIQ